MFIAGLVESNIQKVVVVYPGRFQPFHKGHAAVYNYLVKNYGYDNVYIATSNKVDPPKSPFNFAEKLQMITLTGVDASRVVQTTDPYRALEIAQQYDPESTVLVFAVSEKDMAEDPRFSKFTKKDGSPSYLQPAPKNLSKAQPFSQHGYILTVPTFDFTVLGKPMRSASEFRKQFALADDEQKKKLIKDLFGAYNNQVFKLMKSKITEHIEERIDRDKLQQPVQFNLVNREPRIRTVKSTTNDGLPTVGYEVIDSNGITVFKTNDKKQAISFLSKNRYDLMDSLTEDPERAWRNRMRKQGAVFFQNQRRDPEHKGQYTYAYRVDQDKEDWPHVLVGKFDHAQNREISNRVAESVDIWAIQEEEIRQELLLNPKLFETRLDYQELVSFLKQHQTPNPIVGHQYLYTSVFSLLPAASTNIKYFSHPHTLVKLSDGKAYFDINGEIQGYPEEGTLEGDLLKTILMFKSVDDLDKFLTLFNIRFSNWQISIKEIDDTKIDETLKRVKGKWALVSKSNPKKVLQYYKGGNKRPSKEWVNKVERRVHSFESAGRLDGLPRIRRVTKELADGSKITTYEVLDSEGVTVKSGLSYDLAKEYLNAHRYELMRESLKPTTQELKPLKPRNFVAKNAVNTGAGVHKDKKRAAKQGDVKHKGKMFDDKSPLSTPNNSKKRVCGLEEGPKDMLAKGALAFGGDNVDAGIIQSITQGLEAGPASSIKSSKTNKERTEQDKAFAEKITDPSEKAEYLKRLKQIIHWRNMSMSSPAMMAGYKVREKKFQEYKAELEKKYKSKVKENNISSLNWKRQIHESYGENIRFWRDRAGNKTIAKNLDTNEIVGEYRHGMKTEDAAGVGIVTKQNMTKDVGPDTVNKNLQAFNLIPKRKK